MRTSLVIASHNEGELLWRTVGSCLETSRELDCEVVVADDASTDGCVEEMLGRYPDIRVVRFSERRGVSPTKDLAARSSSGDTLIFLDAHCKPEKGAIGRLVSDIERGGDHAIVSPLLVNLDTGRWQCDPQCAGYGFWVDLRSFNNGWHDRDHLKRVSGPGGRTFYEQPCVVGCAMAMARKVYDRLRGFDIGMRSYGSEDIDFGLRAWQMGYSLLCDPRAVIGHRFRHTHRGYEVPHEHCLFNELRMARKNFGDRSWSDWVRRQQKRADGQVWTAAWELFEQDRRSVELEREFLLANRVRDEYQYARHFGLSWPSPALPAGPQRASSRRESLTGGPQAIAAGGLELARIRSADLDKQPTKAPGWKKPTRKRPTKKPVQPTKIPPPTPPPAPPWQPSKMPVSPTKMPTRPKHPTKRPKGPKHPTKRPKGPKHPTKRPKGPKHPTKRPKGPKHPTKRPKGPKRPTRRPTTPKRPKRPTT